MKIDSQNVSKTYRTQPAKELHKSAGHTERNGIEHNFDAVTLTATSSQIKEKIFVEEVTNQIVQNLKKDEQSRKVSDELRQKVADGSYTTNSKCIAEKILLVRGDVV